MRESATALREVVISAGSFEAASDRRRAVVLSPIDIALTASATADIAGAITTLPGTTRNGESGQILVRGGAAYETRTFIDGLYVQNPYNSSVPNVPARNRFSPFLFKGAQFSTGGYSAEYGQALSSALILHTEDLAPETTTGLSLMSVGLGLAHTQRWERSSMSVSGSYTNLAPYFALIPQNIDWEAPLQSGGGELIYRQKTSDAGMFKLYSSVNRSWMELQYPIRSTRRWLSPCGCKPTMCTPTCRTGTSGAIPGRFLSAARTPGTATWWSRALATMRASSRGNCGLRWRVRFRKNSS
ncbi:MAG: Plug domain-containing protein [Lewinellaceae bacterium]|nr:Plug domain-containing protein [Lewinellaceae bacterium]